MGAFERCPDCGRMVRALHMGGDSQIPDPGVCDACHGIRVGAWMKVEALRVARAIEARVAASAPALEAAAEKAAIPAAVAVAKEVVA